MDHLESTKKPCFSPTRFGLTIARTTVTCCGSPPLSSPSSGGAGVGLRGAAGLRPEAGPQQPLGSALSGRLQGAPHQSTQTTHQLCGGRGYLDL